MDNHRFETREIHAADRPDQYGAVTTPIYTTTTYAYDSPTELIGDYRYARMAAPTSDALQTALADLEGGEHASVFASGMAAIDAVFSLLAPGDHVVAADNLYAETHDLLTQVYPDYGIDVTRVDIREVAALEEALEPSTRLVYFETPTNPLLNVGDIAAAARVADDHDALLAVDNTFASPVLQRPLELGADVVVESLTKFIVGHSDAIGGAVVTRDDDLADRLRFLQYTRGAILGPFDCFLALRGIKTLSGRVRRQSKNAREIAAWLDEQPLVKRVYYPGLASHPNHDVAAEQMADFGSMISFELAGGVDASTALVEQLSVFTLAESLGAVESLVEVPAVMTHQDLSSDDRHATGISDGLVRLSVGTEHEADLLADLDRAMEAVAR